MIWYPIEKKAMINQIEETLKTKMTCDDQTRQIEGTLKTKVACDDWIEQFMCKQGKLVYHFTRAGLWKY